MFCFSVRMVTRDEYQVTGMKRQAIYRHLAEYYDLLYPEKDYKKESDKIRKIIKRHKKTNGNHLLEVACGTGNMRNF